MSLSDKKGCVVGINKKTPPNYPRSLSSASEVSRHFCSLVSQIQKSKDFFGPIVRDSFNQNQARPRKFFIHNVDPDK